MKKTILGFAVILVLESFVALCAFAGELDALAGKWSASKPDAQGQPTQQVLEIKNNKFTFRILRDDEPVLHAEGDVKAESFGPFKAARFYNINGGRTSADLQPVEDDRTVIYSLADNELTLASNFDKQRPEPAEVTKYTKAASAEARTLVIDKIVMHQTPQTDVWYFCFEATVGDVTKRFNVPNKGYEKEPTIPTELVIPGAGASQTCKFVMKLDDVPGDECTDEMDNRSAGSFTVTATGSQTYKPEDHWRYTIYWRLK